MLQIRSVLVLVGLITVVGCGGKNKSDASESGAAAKAPAATARPVDQQASTDSTGEIAGIQLEEVLYSPSPGAPAFIELGNAGNESLTLKFLALQVDENTIPLERFGDSLAPGARVLVLFDGPMRTEGSTHHAGDSVTISSEAGHAAILDRFGNPIDEVAWGDAPGAVNPVAGGVWSEIEPGTSIGRPPGAGGLRSPVSWVSFTPPEVTAGAANPPPTVRGLHPLNGVRAQREGARLSWFPVPGADKYQVQVAGDEKFENPLVDQATERPRFEVATLTAGTYLWRVRAIFSDQKEAAWSEASTVTLIEKSSTSTTAANPQQHSLMARIQQQAFDILLPTRAQAQTPQVSNCPPSASQPGQETCKILAVPFIQQHKDTRMLLLEQNVPAGKHAWDVDHGDLNEDDPADNTNCALASLAMMNKFAGGNLSQDRIGYEIRKAWVQGPEQDIMYARGVNRRTHLPIAYQFALGSASIEHPQSGVDDLWTNVMNQVRNGNPVLSGPPGHNLVIIGFRIVNGHRLLVVNDPWETASQEYDIDDPATRRPLMSWMHWLPTGDFVPGHQEPAVMQDSDGDGVVDFDETERFHTKPDSNDSDNDGVGDKQDIYASVFDRRFGYAKYRTSRDHDSDGKPMERDSDSDDGGCKDGVEDQNANGIHDQRSPANAETWNFEFVDDSCQDLVGHLTYHEHSSTIIVPDVQFGDTASTTSISVRLKPVPGEPGFYEDDGSRFYYQGSHQARTVAPQCQMIGQSWASSTGDFTGPSAGLVQGVITDDGKLGVHFTAGIPNEHTGGWADICGLVSSGRAGDSHSAEFRDECLGDPIEPGERGYVPGHKTFNFSCHDQHWSASGIVTVP